MKKSNVPIISAIQEKSSKLPKNISLSNKNSEILFGSARNIGAKQSLEVIGYLNSTNQEPTKITDSDFVISQAMSNLNSDSPIFRIGDLEISGKELLEEKEKFEVYIQKAVNIILELLKNPYKMHDVIIRFSGMIEMIIDNYEDDFDVQNAESLLECTEIHEDSFMLLLEELFDDTEINHLKFYKIYRVCREYIDNKIKQKTRFNGMHEIFEFIILILDSYYFYGVSPKTNMSIQNSLSGNCNLPELIYIKLCEMTCINEDSMEHEKIVIGMCFDVAEKILSRPEYKSIVDSNFRIIKLEKRAEIFELIEKSFEIIPFMYLNQILGFRELLLKEYSFIILNNEEHYISKVFEQISEWKDLKYFFSVEQENLDKLCDDVAKKIDILIEHVTKLSKLEIKPSGDFKTLKDLLCALKSWHDFYALILRIELPD